jgi:hypothetical protein
MMSVFAWFDYDGGERHRAERDRALRDPDTIDEPGIGSIRDAPGRWDGQSLDGSRYDIACWPSKRKIWCSRVSSQASTAQSVRG